MPDLPGEDDLEGRYANFFQLGFNAYEFVIEFGQQYPPAAERIHTRIVTSAPLMHNFSETLERSLRDFEKKYPPPEHVGEDHEER